MINNESTICKKEKQLWIAAKLILRGKLVALNLLFENKDD